MMQQIIISGFGGQGVLLMGQLLIYAGMTEDRQVSWYPSYGPEMRGGIANCNTIISDDIIGSPIVTEADTVIAMNRPAFEKFESSVVPGGNLFMNTSLIALEPTRDDVRVFRVPANELADKVGNSRTANMVMLGAYLRVTDVVSVDSLMGALKFSFGAKKAHLLPQNAEAIAAGAKAVESQL